MATGKWTLKEWADHAYSLEYRSRNGNRVGKQAWSGIFHHRFYIGKTWLKEGGVAIKGRHKPPADEATFVQLQEILKQHDKYRQHVQRYKYLLRGLVYSLEAGSPCWAETHTRKGISYYRSRTRAGENHIFYNTRDIEEQFPDIFKDITIAEDARQQLKKQLEN